MKGVVAPPSEAAGAPMEPDPVQAGEFSQDSGTVAYRKAHAYFRAAKYPEAGLAFSNFVEKYPDHVFAGDAQYYAGLSYLKQNEPKAAIQEFERVLTSFDRSPKISDTLRDLADAEERLKQTDAAAKHRQLLLSLFPSSPAAASLAGNEPKPERAAEVSSAPAEAAKTPTKTNESGLDSVPETAPAHTQESIPSQE